MLNLYLREDQLDSLLADLKPLNLPLLDSLPEMFQVQAELFTKSGFGGKSVYPRSEFLLLLKIRHHAAGILSLLAQHNLTCANAILRTAFDYFVTLYFLASLPDEEAKEQFSYELFVREKRKTIRSLNDYAIQLHSEIRKKRGERSGGGSSKPSLSVLYEREYQDLNSELNLLLAELIELEEKNKLLPPEVVENLRSKTQAREVLRKNSRYLTAVDAITPDLNKTWEICHLNDEHLSRQQDRYPFNQHNFFKFRHATLYKMYNQDIHPSLSGASYMIAAPGTAASFNLAALANVTALVETLLYSTWCMDRDLSLGLEHPLRRLIDATNRVISTLSVKR
jgi:hypothetical protein